MIHLGKVGSTLWQGLSFLIKHRRVRRGSAAVFFTFVFTLLLAVDFFPSRVDLEVGDVAPYDIQAPHSVEYIDAIKTAELRRQAAEEVAEVYTTDPSAALAVERSITELTEEIITIQSSEELSPEEKAQKLKTTISFELPDKAYTDLAVSDPKETKLVGESVTKLMLDSFDQGITNEQVHDAEAQLVANITKLGYSQSYHLYAIGLVENFIRPNKFYNDEQTEANRRAAMEAVEPVKVTIKAQQTVVKGGDIVTEQDIQELQALGLLHPEEQWVSLLGTALLVAALMSAVLFYLRQQNQEIYHNIKQLYLLGIIALIVLIVAKMLVAIEVSRWPEFGELFGYMAPVAAAGMLTAILLESRLAVLVVAVVSLFMGLMTESHLNFSIVGFLGGITGVYSVSKLSQRGDLVRTGMYISAAVMFSVFVLGMMHGMHWRLMVVSGVVLGLINGILSSVLTNGALPYLESTFGITSSVKLLELSNPSHPLLRQLLTESPGTYHHSIIVGNLAEAAAEAVGGDNLLVRVGALYHDVGKIKRPYFFIENQLAAENPHDKIAPTLSTLILTSHVKDGADLAREHKLPQQVIDIIEQHHGTGLVKYFYHKALEGERAETINEDDFRYEGPKPQTKEAAIVMLADSVEAAVRSMKNPTSGQVEGLVRKLIKDKLMDGQLDECDLTLKDLDTIANVFLRVLSGVFHSRIEYPDMQQEMERRKKRRASLC